MGYGGNLIWTSALVSLQKESPLPLVLAKMPLLSDLLVGKIYCRGQSYANDPIFFNNPRYFFAGSGKKNFLEIWIDRIFILILSITLVRKLYESAIHRYAESKAIALGKRYVYLDMRIHSYAEKVLGDRVVWKKNSRAASAVLSEYKPNAVTNSPEIFFLDMEKREAEKILKEKGVLTPYIAIDLDSNPEYFGSLRSWPLHNWRELVEALNLRFPGTPLVRIGVKSVESEIFGLIDLRGDTTFRQAALIINQALFFIGTEGGLMHAARAVNAKAVILWGGVTLPEFAGYPDAHHVVCNYVPCAPCGLLGNCPHENICMTSIDVKQVLEKIALII